MVLKIRKKLIILGACGEREELYAGVWEEMPEAKSPDDSEPLMRNHGGEGSLHQYVDVRMARGMFGFSGTGKPSGDNNSLFWVRMPEVQHDAGALAIMADYMPSAFGNAFGEIVGCTSIDNTIRIANREESEWILCDNRISFAGNGFGYGRVNMWSDRGTLLATAGQTVIIRRMQIDPQ